MKKVKPTITVYDPPKQEDLIKRIIRAARNCYKSEDLSNPESDIDLIRRLIKMNHSSIFEQGVLQVREDLASGIGGAVYA